MLHVNELFKLSAEKINTEAARLILKYEEEKREEACICAGFYGTTEDMAARRSQCSCSDCLRNRGFPIGLMKIN